MIVGVDEAGRGPLAGPVVACALYFKEKINFKVKDSKELSPQRREELFHRLLEKSVYSLACHSNNHIDQHNILASTFSCCNRAIGALLKKLPSSKKPTFIIDGNLFSTALPIKYKCVVGADKKVKEVSAASIMAKVVRDHFMRLIDTVCPEWEFSRHKGYPTKRHRELIDAFGACEFHRNSFRW